MVRLDGRRADELRPVTIEADFVSYAEGSVLICMGATRVLCNVTIEDSLPRWMHRQGITGGWITAEYAMLPRSTHDRTPRETMGLSGRTQEIRRLIGRSLRSAIDLEKLGSRTCIIDCDVLQADGGTRTASITGGYVALAIALKQLIQEGLIPPGTLRSPVAAISVGIIQGMPLLDLNYQEDSTAEVDANIVMNADGQFIEVQATAEGKVFPRNTLDHLLDLASRGIGDLLAMQQTVLNKD